MLPRIQDRLARPSAVQLLGRLLGGASGRPAGSRSPRGWRRRAAKFGARSPSRSPVSRPSRRPRRRLNVVTASAAARTPVRSSAALSQPIRVRGSLAALLGLRRRVPEHPRAARRSLSLAVAPGRMVGGKILDQLADAGSELERKMRRRRPDEGVDVADGGLGHDGASVTICAGARSDPSGVLARARAWPAPLRRLQARNDYLHSLSVRWSSFRCAFCLRTNAARSLALRVLQEVRPALRRHLPLVALDSVPAHLLQAALPYFFAAALGCTGAARPTDAGEATPANAQTAAQAQTIARRMRKPCTADRVAAGSGRAATPCSGDRRVSSVAPVRRPLSTELMLLTTVVSGRSTSPSRATSSRTGSSRWRTRPSATAPRR